MNKLILTTFAVLAVANIAFAKNNNCSLIDDKCGKNDNPEDRICTAIDNQGETFNYYTPTWWQAPYTKKQALKKCKENSEVPASCKISGCVEY